MATKKAPRKKTIKMTSEEFATKMTKLHPKLVRAVKGVVKKSGVPGAKLHSAQLFLAHANLQDPQCSKCKDNETCVFDPMRGEWVCRSK
jgi:hypothetical protein